METNPRQAGAVQRLEEVGDHLPSLYWASEPVCEYQVVFNPTLIPPRACRRVAVSRGHVSVRRYWPGRPAFFCCARSSARLARVWYRRAEVDGVPNARRSRGRGPSTATPMPHPA